MRTIAERDEPRARLVVRGGGEEAARAGIERQAGGADREEKGDAARASRARRSTIRGPLYRERPAEGRIEREDRKRENPDRAPFERILARSCPEPRARTYNRRRMAISGAA